MKRKLCLMIMCLGMLLVSACGAKETGYQKIVDEYAKLFLAADEDGKIMWDGLELIGDYLNGNLEQKDAISNLREKIDTLYERMDGVQTYSVDSEFSETLEEYGILPEEFELLGNSRKTWIQDSVSMLEFLQEYLVNAEVTTDDYAELQFFHELYVKIEECERAYFYYACINYWFAEWDEEQTAYVQAQVIDKLQAYYSEEYTWETSRAMTEEKTMLYLDEMEEYMNLMAERIGVLNTEMMEAE